MTLRSMQTRRATLRVRTTIIDLSGLQSNYSPLPFQTNLVATGVFGVPELLTFASKVLN